MVSKDFCGSVFVEFVMEEEVRYVVVCIDLVYEGVKIEFAMKFDYFEKKKAELFL